MLSACSWRELLRTLSFILFNIDSCYPSSDRSITIFHRREHVPWAIEKKRLAVAWSGEGKGSVTCARSWSCQPRWGTRVIRGDSCAAEMALGLRCHEDKSSNGARDFWLPASIRTRMSGYARETRADTQIGSISVPWSHVNTCALEKMKIVGKGKWWLDYDVTWYFCFVRGGNRLIVWFRLFFLNWTINKRWYCLRVVIFWD